MEMPWFASLLLLLVCNQATKAATHWVVTEDGKIHTQDDSVFTLRRPYDLVSLLDQEKRAEALKRIKSQLMVQKQSIEASASEEDETGPGTIVIDSDTDMEQVVYATNEDCNKAGKALPEFDLYIGTILFLPSERPETASDSLLNLLELDEAQVGDQRLSGDPLVKAYMTLTDDYSAPNCSQMNSLDFSMHSYEHLQGMRNRHNLDIDAETDIHSTITSIDDIEDYGNAVFQALKQNKTSWILYSMASYYWRAKGKGDEAAECIRRALHFCPHKDKHIPLTSLGNILHRGHHSEEAAIVLHHAIDVSSENPITHFTLGNIYAVLADYNKSLICYENVLKLDPNFSEAKLRYHAVLCHQKVEKALRAQHDSLQKTLEELQGYQKQQELWLQYQQKLLSEQAPPGVVLEQRLQYREHKIREIIDSNLNSAPNAQASGTSNGSGAGVGANVRKLVNASPGSASVAANAGGRGIKQSIEPCGGSRDAERGRGGDEECQMVPILIPITFVPPS